MIHACGQQHTGLFSVEPLFSGGILAPLMYFSVSFFYWNRQIQTNSQRNAFPAWPLSRKLGHSPEHRRLRRRVLNPQRTKESLWPPRRTLEKGASPCRLIHLRGLHIQPQGIKSPLQARLFSFLLQLLKTPLVIISLLCIPFNPNCLLLHISWQPER